MHGLDLAVSQPVAEASTCTAAAAICNLRCDIDIEKLIGDKEQNDRKQVSENFHQIESLLCSVKAPRHRVGEVVTSDHCADMLRVIYNSHLLHALCEKRSASFGRSSTIALNAGSMNSALRLRVADGPIHQEQTPRVPSGCLPGLPLPPGWWHRSARSTGNTGWPWFQGCSTGWQSAPMH